MRYEDVAHLLPALVDAPDAVDDQTLAFIHTDLRCQADLARYRRLVRALGALRERYADPGPEALALTLDAIEDAIERAAGRGGTRGVITRRRVAGAIGTTAVAATAATAAVLIARSRRRGSGLRLAG